LTPFEERLARTFQLRAARMAPDMASAILATIRELRKAVSAGDFLRAVELGHYLEKLEAILNGPAFTPVRTEIRRAVQEAIRYQSADIPKPPAGRQSVNVGFDILNPKHIDAIRTLETRVIQTLQQEQRDVIRAHIENGLRDGKGVRSVARGIRDVVGLAPNQLKAVDSFRKALEEGDVSKALGYKLRDKRLKVSEAMTPAQIDRAVEAYKRKFIAHHANTVATTATLDALKKGQHLVWQDAIDRGLVDGSRLQKTWVQVQRPTKRDEHIPLNGETVPFHSTYSNGQMIPGETDYLCACVSRITQKRAA
jgi:hypothetical protein